MGQLSLFWTVDEKVSLALHVRLLLSPIIIYLFFFPSPFLFKVLLLLKPGLARLSTLLKMRTAVSLETPRSRRNAFTWVAGGTGPAKRNRKKYASNHRSVTRSKGICTINAGKCDPCKMCLRLRLRLCVCREGAHTEIQIGQDMPTIAAVVVAKSKLYSTRISLSAYTRFAQTYIGDVLAPRRDTGVYVRRKPIDPEVARLCDTHPGCTAIYTVELDSEFTTGPPNCNDMGMLPPHGKVEWTHSPWHTLNLLDDSALLVNVLLERTVGGVIISSANSLANSTPFVC